MKKYCSYTIEKMILRDHLAVDRTTLANERTLLAYLRTSLSLIVAGSSFIKFFDILIMSIIGYFFITLGFIIGILGLKKYLHIKNRLRYLMDKIQ